MTTARRFATLAFALGWLVVVWTVEALVVWAGRCWEGRR
jgi:hypothetical protein